MALGIPIITTKFGGVLEYAKPNYCNYFEPKEYKAQQNMDGIPQFANCIWPALKVSEISNKLRYVFENWPAEKIKDAYNYVHANYNYEVIGQKLLEVINA
jgi:glycosyltransferase involved in cell wall biosynthesis